MEDNNQSQTLIKKNTNSNTGLIIALVATISALVIASIVLIIVLVTKNNEENEAKEAEEAKIATISETQKDDLSRFLTAANDYQTNNNGKTPWHNGETNTKFVKRYIDENCSREVPEKEDNTCGSYFRDPLDGKPYHFAFRGELTEDKKAMVGNDHGISVYTKAYCGEEGYVLEGTGFRQYALLYKLADGSIACNDNH